MTARDIYDAIQGVPAEALCEGIGYCDETDTWRFLPSLAVPLCDDRAAALQRDAMWLWLENDSGWFDSDGNACEAFVRLRHDDDSLWAFMVDGDACEVISLHDTALLALAAAVRYVAGQKGKA